MIRVIAIFAVLFFGSPLAAQDLAAPVSPLLDGHTRTGVPSCTSAGCHGDQVAGDGAGPVVAQNEYSKWRASGVMGAHSRAYDVLLSPWGERIARNLGIDAAHEADMCLDCHADNIPAEQRSPRFQLSDGVGCEACHGGAQNWLALHRVGPGHDKNIEAGLYPTEQPIARAELCLNCHLGSSAKNQMITHRIMGAGHPRLKFELDLYTQMQRHHVIDADYHARKTVASGAKIWAVGQAYAFKRTMTLLADAKTGMDGAFPELVFFDCHACHQTINDSEKDLSWRPHPLRALGPGKPVLQDAHVLMVLAAMKTVNADFAERVEREILILHTAAQAGQEELRRAAQKLAGTADESAAMLTAFNFSEEKSVKAILEEITSKQSAAHYTNYAAAEQAVFAVQRLTAALGSPSAKLTTAIEDAGKAARGPYDYDQNAFKQALTKIRKNLP